MQLADFSSDTSLEPIAIATIVAEILSIGLDEVHIHDTYYEEEIGSRDAEIRCVYSVCDDTFPVGLNVHSRHDRSEISNHEFTEKFVEASKSRCLIDAADGTFTWILFEPGTSPQRVELDEEDGSIIKVMTM